MTAPRTRLWGAALFLLAFAGCSSNEAATLQAPTGPQLPTETGSIRGNVIDEGLLPVSGANVAVLDTALVVQTNTAGAFLLEDVPVGERILVVQVPGYEPASARVLVEEGQTTPADITLKRVAAEEAFHELQIGKGLFGCGATYRQGVTTVNGAFFGLSFCGVGASTTGLDDFVWNTTLRNSIQIWRGAAFETEWQSTQAFGNGMVQDWAVRGCDNNRNATFTRDAGPSPLRSVINAFQLDYRMKDMTENARCGSGANAFDAKDRCNEKSCDIQNRMFSWPSTFGQESTVDVGVTLQQPFTTYLTEFYRAEPPAGYSAIADS